MSQVRRPMVRYHGGKWKLAPWIIAHFPPHHTYTESFGGGGSVLLRKERSYAEVYNDLDEEIVNVFAMARDRGDELSRALELTPFSRSEFNLSYRRCEDPLEQARRTIVRAFQGFGSDAASGKSSGFRSTSNRSGTTPAHDWRNLPEAFAAIVDRLRGVVIENRDALVVMRHHDRPRTLHYVDPPYVHSTRKMGNPSCKKGYKFEMRAEEHQQLAEALHSLEGMVVLSGYPSPLYDDLYADWHCIRRAALADGALPRIECLWLNPASLDALRLSRGVQTELVAA